MHCGVTLGGRGDENSGFATRSAMVVIEVVPLGIHALTLAEIGVFKESSRSFWESCYSLVCD